MHHTPRHLRSRKRLSFALAFTFLFNTLFPSGFAAAQVVFSRPGPGVSRLPLNVSAFDAPGFGEVADAVNLATGNVYVSLDSMSRNNLTGENGEDAVGDGQWQLLPRMRLVGFNDTFGKSVPLMLPLLSGGAFAPVFVTGAVPETLTLAQGDGSSLYFDRASSVPYEPPSWLARYAGIQNNGAYLYRLRTEPKVQYAQDWIVYLPKASGSFAHYYTRDGARYTFHKDGEYVDYVQDTYQQYLGAKDHNDPDGAGASTPKTEFSYATAQQDPQRRGRITKIKDAYGRVTTYEWDFSNDTLSRINYLLSSEADNNSYARRADFTYATPTGSGQRVVDKVTYTADDGLGTRVSRWVDFDHTVTGGRVLVHKIKQQVLGGANSVSTTYGYDTAGRVKTVDQTGQPQIVYTHDTSVNYDGPQVTVSQGVKSSTYEHSTQGQLVRKSVAYQNPDAGSSTSYTWSYTYNTSGSTASISHPGGKTEAFGYDYRGNLTSLTTSWSGVSSGSRQQTFFYDDDNRLVSDTLKGQNFTLDTVTHSYKDVTWSYGYQNFAAPAGHPYFTPVSKVTRILSVNNVSQYSVTDAYSAGGLLQSSTRAWKDADGVDRTRATSYAYHAGAAGTVYRIKSDGAQEGYTTKQYGDLVSSVTVTGLSTTYYRYDALSHLAYEYQAGAFVSGYTGTTANPASARTVTRAYNGFGGLTGEQVGGAGKPGSKRYLAYYPTGELKYSWEGGPENVTQYTYTTDAASANLGRPATVYRGVDGDANGTVDTRRGYTKFGYDTFGRVATREVDSAAYVHSYLYDTSDRVVRETRPDAGYTRYTYTAAGEVSSEGTLGVGWTYFERDALGRATKVTHPAPNSHSFGATVLTTYDPYDRPVKVVDNRLAMNNAGDDRASYFTYDSLGNLRQERGPVLRSADSGGYKDDRRPYAAYFYDVLGRLTKEQRLINGTIIAKNTTAITLSESSSDVAVTELEYDLHDRLEKVTDPEGYETAFAYDGVDNLVSETKQVWKTTELDYSTVQNGFNNVITRYAYDAAGRVTKVVDPRGYAFETTYDALGNAITQKDARGVVTHVYAYTDDGLLEKVAEPDPDLASATATGFGSDGAAPTNYTVTKKYSYGSRRVPSSLSVASEDKDALTSGATTSYVYDWAGRATTTTLPGGATVIQDYDTRGNLESITNAEGFVTKYKYDALDRVTEEHQPKRPAGAGKTTDDAAFGSVDGLKTTYTYDTAGNLTKENRNGLYTHYTYNSLGKVMAETRPNSSNTALDSADLPNARLKAYRLDGALTAETTYDYAGDLRGGDASKVAAITYTTPPSVDKGNVTAYTVNKRGERRHEQSKGVFQNAAQTEHYRSDYYDGLGRRYRRYFSGSAAIYANMRKSDGTLGSYAYYTYWKHDQNGNLREKWDAVGGDATKHNLFTYQYSATNKETFQSWNVSIALAVAPMRSSVGSYDATVLQNFKDQNPVTAAFGIGRVSTAYNSRDLVRTTDTTDEDPSPSYSDLTLLGTVSTTKTTYAYYKSGLLEQASVNGGSRTLRYDARGRVTKVEDSDGGVKATGQSDGPTTNHTAYGADGKVTQDVRLNNTTCVHKTVSYPTVGGLTYKVDTWDNGAYSKSCTSTLPVRSTATQYDAAGLPSVVTVANSENGTYDVQTKTHTHDYTNNAYGYKTGEAVTATLKRKTSGDTGADWKTTTLSAEAYSVAYSYTLDGGHLSGYTFTPGSGSAVTTNYVLDSRGNRLEVTGTDSPANKYYGYKKRYDADGRVAEFHKTFTGEKYDERLYDGYPVDNRHFVHFRYDPYGNQILSSKASINQSYVTYGNQFDGEVLPNYFYTISRENYSNAVVGGDVQLIRLHSTRSGYRKSRKYSSSASNYYYVRVKDEASTYRLKDERFSLADGILEETWGLSEIDYYEAESPATDATLPLEAPSEAVSDRLGVLPTEVVAPSDALPDLGTGVGEVLPPVEGEASAPAEDTTENSSPGSVESFSTSDTGLSELPGLAELPSLEPAPAPTEEVITEPFDLAAPTDALPPALSEVSAADVVAPESTTGTLPPDVGDVGEVTAPGETAPPSVGTNPSEGIGEVAPPSSIATPTIPQIGNGAPDAISKVAPPIGWENGTSINTFGENPIVVNCGGYLTTPNDPRCQNPENLDQELEKLRAEVENALEDDSKREDQKLGLLNLLEVAEKYGINSDEAYMIRVINNASERLAPQQRGNMLMLVNHLTQTPEGMDKLRFVVDDIISPLRSRPEADDERIAHTLNVLITAEFENYSNETGFGPTAEIYMDALELSFVQAAPELLSLAIAPMGCAIGASDARNGNGYVGLFDCLPVVGKGVGVFIDNYRALRRGGAVLGIASDSGKLPSLPKHLKNKLKRINNEVAAGGNRGISGTYTRNEVNTLAERFVGPEYIVTNTANGTPVYVSADGLRQVRFPSAKRSPHSQTGYQANFEQRLQPSSSWTSNVHLDVIP